MDEACIGNKDVAEACDGGVLAGLDVAAWSKSAPGLLEGWRRRRRRGRRCMWTASARPWTSSHPKLFPQQKSAWSIAGERLVKTKTKMMKDYMLSFPIRDVHGLDLGVLAKRHAMDTFSFIRLVVLLNTKCCNLSLDQAGQLHSPGETQPRFCDVPLLLSEVGGPRISQASNPRRSSPDV